MLSGESWSTLMVDDNKDLIKKMRTENYERFKALVRMHLSFELDMNMDEFDMPCNEIMYYEKGKMKKWSRLTKKIKSCASSKINSPAEDNSVKLTTTLIMQLRKLKEFLMTEENIKQEGIFRLAGAISRQNELRSLINSQQPFDLKRNYTVHDCATVFKNILSHLPEPVLTDAHYSAYCQIAELCNNDDKDSSCGREIHVLHSVQLLLLLLPEENDILFTDIIEMLNKTIMYKDFNKMSADSLATLFSPHLICPRNLPAEALFYISQNMSKIISYMIKKGPQIFEAPSKLMTDIRAYFVELKRKKTMSPERTLDESISDLSTVNTVYTFVDREKTAAANNSDPTDTALAQLYAHIQSLPESSKKRKLIRQFNKENGQGTPLQLLIMNRMRNEGSTTRNTKSISDSIKKHIFQKSIMSRTPKRSNISLSNFGTPNAATKISKSRVLFQSPICNSNINLSASIKKHNLHKSVSSSSLLTMKDSSKLEFKKSLTPVTCTEINNKVCSELPSSSIVPVITEQSDSEIIPFENIFKVNKSSRKELGIIDKKIPNCESFKQDLNIEKIQEFPKLKSKSEPNLCVLRNIFQADLYTNYLRRRSNSMTNIKFGSGKNVQLYGDFLQKRSFSESSNSLNSPFIVSDFENISTNICRNKKLITSTPSVFLDRKSMSPITKSTQRMPKSMQESIMTPRSRKPVMLTTLGSSEQNHIASNLEDENSLLITDQVKTVDYQIKVQKDTANNREKNTSLTDDFKEYLFSRKVLTASPEDSSFSSHSDDFGSTQDIHNFSEEDLSESLLYCLNGNKPVEDNGADKINVISRKRSVLQNDDKENYRDKQSKEKKLFVVKETINETSI